MKKLTLLIAFPILFLLTVEAILFFYSLPKENISHITSCTHGGARLLDVVGNQIRIPSSFRYLNIYLPFSASVCDIHLKKYRGTKDDIEYLNVRAGAYAIASENKGSNGLRNRKKNVENLKFLINKGLDVNSKFNLGGGSNVTPLWLAVASNELETVQILLDNGADPNIRDSRGFTPLEMAIKLKEAKEGLGYDGATDTSGVIGILKEAQLKK